MKCVVFGAAGRMGRQVVAAIQTEPDLSLHAAVERAGNPLLGTDAGEVAGVGRLGVAITPDRIGALRAAEVAIDFTEPLASVQNVQAAGARGVPIVVGTTGHTAEQSEQIRAVATRVPIVFSPNLSVGMNLLFALLPRIARALGEEYDIEVVEMHHRLKRDAPSGTALKIGELLASARGWKLDEVGRFERRGVIGERPPQQIGVQSLRAGDVVGDHTVYFATVGERLEVTHRATSRFPFARGAVRAARWLPGQAPGLYEMQDVLGLGDAP
jgi:4-hydroxy-tetrahydrodipicolinate reductase